MLWLSRKVLFSLPSFSRLSDCFLPFPTEHIEKFTLSLNRGHLKLCGGKNIDQRDLSQCFQYDPELGEHGKWTRDFSMTQSRYSAVAATLPDGTLWMAGGISTEFLNSSEILKDKGELKKKHFMLLALEEGHIGST